MCRMFSASAMVRCCSDATSRCRSSTPGNAPDPAFEPAQRDGQAGELLAGIVVQIAGEA